MNESLTFEQQVQRWIASKKPYVKRSTFSVYSVHLQSRLVPAFGPMTAVTEADVQAFVDRQLGDGMSIKTVKDMLMILKMVLRFAAKQGGWENRPMEIHYPPVKTRAALPTLCLRDHKRLMTYLQEHTSNYNMGIFLCLGTGMRIGELCALKWEDLDLKAGYVRVSKTIQRIYSPFGRHSELVVDAPKSANSFREIPLSHQMILAFRPLKREARGSWYLLTGSPKPAEPRVFRNYFYRLCKELGLPRIPFHGLRHTFATRCIESKCDYKTVSALLGHANISTTLNLYVHPDLAQKKKVVEQMSRRLL
jgi:integrase